MRLYLARHGKALPKTEDPERSLSDIGRKEVSHVSDLLEQTGAGVDRLIHSGKRRAQQTAEILSQSVMWEVELEIARDMNPSDPIDPWLERIRGLGADTMLVGHLPFLSKLTSKLVTGGEAPDIVVFRTGTVACLEPVEDGRWAVVAVICPSL